MLTLDGVVSGDAERGVRFQEATGLEAPDAEALARTVQLRVLRWFTRRGLLDPSTAADMRTWQGTGGFSVDGSVRIEDEDRAGLERLVGYCARGPLALERPHASAGLEALTSPEARLVYRLTEPDMHGHEELRLPPIELVSPAPPPAPRTRPSSTAHRNILRAPIPMAPRPPSRFGCSSAPPG